MAAVECPKRLVPAVALARASALVGTCSVIVRGGCRIIAIISHRPAYTGERQRGLPIRMEADRVSVATMHNRRRLFGVVAPAVLLAGGACATAAPTASLESIPAATAAENASSAGPALPQPDYLTFGQDAGSVLIGLTVRPALSGPNDTLDVRAASRRTGRCCGRPVEPGSAAAKHAADARLSLDGPPHRRGRVHKNRPRSTKVVRPGLGD